MTYHLISLLLNAVSHLPFRVMYAISGVLYAVTYHIVGYRRKIAHKNLTECFPEKSPSEIKEIEKGFYRYFIDNILETCKMHSMTAKEMSRRMRFVNIDEINGELRKGKSIALYLGHYANWEWISSMPLHLEKDAVAAQIYHRLSNADFDRLMLHNRSRFGAVNVEMRKTARFINEMTTEHKVSITGFIADQSPRKKDINHYVQFLNHETPVVTGTEKITHHFDLQPWFVRPTKVRRGYYEVEFVRMCDDSRSLPGFGLTDIYFRMLEQTIRQHPELYLWTHNRFRYSPSLQK